MYIVIFLRVTVSCKMAAAWNISVQKLSKLDE